MSRRLVAIIIWSGVAGIGMQGAADALLPRQPTFRTLLVYVPITVVALIVSISVARRLESGDIGGNR